MHPSGYYKTNLRALRMRELVRWYGWWKGFKAFLKLRSTRSTAGVWMPGLWSEIECKREDLSEDFWAATRPHRNDFEKLGFVECGCFKVTRSLSPIISEVGGIRYLDASRRYFGQLLYRKTNPTARKAATHEIIISFTAVFEQGTFSCTNHNLAFDEPATDTVLRLKSYDVHFIYRQFIEQLQQQKQTAREFPDFESLKQWFDVQQIKTFEERVARRLFVPMTEREVADAKARLETRTASTVVRVAPKPRLSIPWAIWLLIIAGIISLQVIQHRHRNGRADTIEYRGQQFQMRKAYATYDDYKDDPNNLATNELDRIEQVMISAQVPKTFRDRKEFIEFMVYKLGFPGYGMSSFMGKTDDGSSLHIETVEIPQRDKDRVVVVREADGQFRLADDFVYNTSTNDIARVELEKGALHYFDRQGILLRQKNLSE